jgi:TolB-like protein/Tfp pilus assembly protein PilF
MAGAGTAPKVVRFDAYEIDLGAGQVHKRGVRISLREQSFQVLALLLERPGDVVTREELRRRLWPEDVFVDFDNNLNTAVARLREALSDSAEHPRFIETLPKRGYRFLAALAGSGPAEQRAPAPRARMVVLPFTNLSGDPAQEYLSDAMTEEIITELSGLGSGQLTVIARTTAMNYKGSSKDVGRIGRELSVDYLVEGGMRRAEDRVVTTVQLIRVKDQAHLWAKRYDAALSDVFSARGEIAREITDRIEIAAGPATRKPAADVTAYNLFLRGRYHVYQGTPSGVATARKLFEEAIGRDPGFALAYEGLAELFWYLGFWGYAPPKEAFSAGVFYALRAVEIDNTIAETHALLGMYRKELDYNWPEVQREMALALKLNPASPVVRFRYAFSGLMPHGRIQEAVAELERALESDPLSPTFLSTLAFMFGLGRQYDRGIEQLRRLLELDPNSFVGHLGMGMLYRYMEAFEPSIAAYRRSAELSGGSPLSLGWLGEALARAGATMEARALLEQLRRIAAESYVPSSSFAWIHLGLGEFDSAFAWMDRAVDERDPMMVPIKSYPFFDPIRADPRFLALLRKMNLEA